MANILTQLKLEELSVVDTPANPLAMAPLFKRHSEEEIDKMDMSPDKEKKIKAYMKEKGCSRSEAMKALGYMEKNDMDELQEKFDSVKAENERLRKALIENDFVIKADAIEKKAPVEQIEIDGEMVNKSDIPAPVLKALETAKQKEEMAALEKRAGETLPHFDKEVAMAMLKFDLDDKVLEALKAADAAFEAAMKEVGESATEDMADPEAKLNKMVEEVQKSGDLTYHKAYAQVVKTQAGRALLKEMKEVK